MNKTRICHACIYGIVVRGEYPSLGYAPGTIVCGHKNYLEHQIAIAYCRDVAWKNDLRSQVIRARFDTDAHDH